MKPMTLFTPKALAATIFVVAHTCSLRVAAQVVPPASILQPEKIDLDNIQIPPKYSHPLPTVFLISQRLPKPPTDPQARERYIEATGRRRKGMVFLFKGQAERAIAMFNQAAALWPDCAENYRWLAEAYTANDQVNQAIANYRLLFYGWPGKSSPSPRPDDNPLARRRIDNNRPSDKPSDYDKPNPEETDPILLMQFSLLLQQTKQYAEAQTVYERGMQIISAQGAASGEPLPPVSAASLTTPSALEAATRIALVINQRNTDDNGAKENLGKAIQLQPESPVVSYYKEKILK